MNCDVSISFFLAQFQGGKKKTKPCGCSFKHPPGIDADGLRQNCIEEAEGVVEFWTDVPEP